MLAEIASSPAGQTEGLGPTDGSDVRPSPVELHVPARAGQLSSSGECCRSGPPCSLHLLAAPWRRSGLLRQEEKPLPVINQCIPPPAIVWGSCAMAQVQALLQFYCSFLWLTFWGFRTLFSSRMLQRPVWWEVIIVLVFMGLWVPASSLIVKALRALKAARCGMLAVSRGVPVRQICSRFSPCL